MIALVVALAAPAVIVQCETTLAARKLLAFELPAEPKKEQVRWVGEWGVALVEARQRNVPLLAILADDQSAGFNTMGKLVYSKPPFAAFSRKCVLVAAFDGKRHPMKVRKIDGRDVSWCDLFSSPCDAHRKNYEVVRELFAQREYWQPLMVFVASDSSELARAEGHEVTQARLDEELALAQKTLGPGLDASEHRELLQKLRQLADSREQKGHAVVHAELLRMVESDARAAKERGARRALATDGMREFAEQLIAALLQEGDGMVLDAAALAEQKELGAARKLLIQVQRSFRGLPPAEAAAAAAAKLPPDPPSKQ